MIESGLKITITSDKKQYEKGEPINISLDIKNNTSKKLIVNEPIINYNLNLHFENVKGGQTTLKPPGIPPVNFKIQEVALESNKRIIRRYDNIDFYLSEYPSAGEYKIYFVYMFVGNTIASNCVKIEITD